MKKMKKVITSLLFVSCALICFSQVGIILNREYDYVGNEVNKAGLRVVGLKDNSRKLLLGCVDSDGNEVIKPQYSRIILSNDINYIIAQKTHIDSYPYWWKFEETRSSSYNIEPHPFFDAVLYSEKGDYLGGPWSLLNISPYTFCNYNCAIIRTEKGNYGIINSKGENLFQPVYSHIQWLDSINGHLAVSLNEKWGIIDYRGHEICSVQYTDFNAMNGMASVTNSKGERGIIDSNNNIIVPFGKYYSIRDFNGKTFWGRELQSDAYVVQLFSIDGTVLNDLSNIFKKYRNKKRYTEINVNSRDDVKEVSIYDEKNEDEPWIDYYFDDNGQVYNDFDLAKAANDAIRKAEKEYHETNELASLMWLSSTESVQDKTFNLLVRAQSNSEIQDVYLIVNGSTYKDLGINKPSEHEMTISKEISLNEGSNTIQVCVRNAAGTTKEEKTIVYRPQGDGLPSIEWIAFDPTSNNKERLLKFGIKSKSKIEDVTVTVNGSQARGIKTVDSDKYDMVIEHPINLTEGTNHIAVSVRNREGIVTKERSEYYSDITPTPVFNDKRIALVIGNSDYSKPEMKLKNPINDAQDIAEKLESLGFHVILKTDATLNEMKDALVQFELQAAGYDVALFYFAGHGIQSKGENYLLPVNIDHLTEGSLPSDCLPASRALSQMAATPCRLKIAILDACRNDPLSRGWYRGTGTRGLSTMDSPMGTIIAFSTAPGHTASDGSGRNSPYTESFLKVLNQPNLDIDTFLKKVGAQVQEKTERSQIPWYSTSYTGSFYFNPK